MKNLLAKTSNWKFIVPALFIFIGCLYLFQTAQAEMEAITGEETLLIDVRRDYTLAEINDFFTKLKPEGRAIHQHTTAVVDSVFPFAYGTLFILIIAFLLKKVTYPDSNWMYLSLFPILLMIVDFMENFNTLNLLEKFPNLTADMVDSASKITDIKSMLTNISMVVLPLGLGLVWLVKWGLNRNK